MNKEPVSLDDEYRNSESAQESDTKVKSFLFAGAVVAVGLWLLFIPYLREVYYTSVNNPVNGTFQLDKCEVKKDFSVRYRSVPPITDGTYMNCSGEFTANNYDQERIGQSRLEGWMPSLERYPREYGRSYDAQGLQIEAVSYSNGVVVSEKDSYFFNVWLGIYLPKTGWIVTIIGIILLLLCVFMLVRRMSFRQ